MTLAIGDEFVLMIGPAFLALLQLYPHLLYELVKLMQIDSAEYRADYASLPGSSQ
jgi:hypothetical protein